METGSRINLGVTITGITIIALGAAGITIPTVGNFVGKSYATSETKIVGAALVFVGAILLGLGRGASPESLTKMILVFRIRLPHLFFHLFFTTIFIVDTIFLVLFLLYPDFFSSPNDLSHKDIQIFGCIATTGLLGGFIRQIHTNLRPVVVNIENEVNNSDGSRESPYVKFWTVLFSLFTALFTAVVLFLLLRAGILKTVEVDTFNIYGVTGVAAVSGYFSDNIVRRFSTLYENIFGSSKTA